MNQPMVVDGRTMMIIHSEVPVACVTKIVFCNWNYAFASCDGPIVGGNITIVNTIVRHSHDGSASAEILSVGPIIHEYARYSHFYARSPHEAKSAVRNGLWITAFSEPGTELISFFPVNC